jgi:hypothetical protein
MANDVICTATGLSETEVEKIRFPAVSNQGKWEEKF